MNKKITEASGFKEMQDVLRGGCANVNLATKGCGSGQNSLIQPSIDTTGNYAINGEIAAVTATSTFFTLEETALAAFEGVAFVLTIDDAATPLGRGHATNILTSAQISESHSALLSGGMTSAAISTAGGPGYDVLKSVDIVWPEVPTDECTLGIYAVAGADSAHTAGSHTFSHATSDGGTHKFFQRMNMVVNS